jgi:group I intron endonuclease
MEQKPTLNYNGHANEGGVYKIFNSKTQRIYIGSAKRFKERWHGHYSQLKNNRHSNKFLQNEWNKCSPSDFIFEVIEVVDGTKETRWSVEQRYINEHFDNQTQCYNFKQNSDMQKLDRSCFSKSPEETRKKMSENAKKMWSDAALREKIIKARAEARTPESLEKERLGKLRSWEKNESRREVMSKHGKRRWNTDKEYKEKVLSILHAPESRKKASEALCKALKEKPEMREAISRAGREKVARNNERYATDPAYRAYMDELSIKNIQEYNTKKIEKMPEKKPLVSPDGQIHNGIKSLSAFAKEHGLDASTLYKLYNGKIKQYKGWRLAI